ncbi:MAG: hypothetical protein KGJ13_07790 [Patescibacteria group bacterium]|nr:hypothetical protein [Patescibacteria group bacterium]
MKIPTNLEERENFYQDLTQKCLVSKEDRKQDYDSWRSWYLFGNGPDDPPAHFNKIYPHVDQLISFLYSQETTRFSVVPGASVDPREFSKIPALTQAINDKWHDSNTDTTFGLALTWSMAYASTFIKLIVMNGQVYPYVIEPKFIGVLREDSPGTDKQDAFVHIYYITKSELYRRIYAHPKRDKILERINAMEHPVSDVPEAVDRIVMSQTTPQMMGNVNLDLYGYNRMRAKVGEETIEMRELYVWNDDTDDYQVVTTADPDVVIYDRENEKLFLKGESPIIQVCPNPMPDYFWGMSEVQRLVSLQQLRNNRMAEILELLKRQVNPPKALYGFTGIFDEKNFALNREGGLLASDMPNAKADVLAPQMPEDLWREIQEIDNMFSEASGITPIAAGRGEQGVRSAGHASQLARLGSSRAKKRALIVEDNLERIATLYLKVIKERDRTHYTDTEGNKFIAEQFTNDFTVKVDAHSNSPIFVENTQALAFALYKAQAIDKEMLVRILQPPMEQMILDKLKHLPPAQQMAPVEHKKEKHGGDGLKAIEGGKSG